jgi:hypothetical protein
MSKTGISYGTQTRWFRDEPSVIWFRVLSLNLDSEELFALLPKGGVDELREALFVQSQLYGASNSLGIAFDHYLRTDNDIIYFKAAVKRVNKILVQFGEHIDTKFLQALGFSGNPATEIATEMILAIGQDVLEILPEPGISVSNN